MKIFCKILNVNSESREGIITETSGLGILVNILVAALKVVVGLVASSIAIVSEGLNNASDAMSSTLTLIGTKLSKKHPDEKHPFGYGRIEYLTGLVISVIILVTGVEMLISSVKLIFKPEKLSISYVSLIVVAVTAVIKFFLGLYTIKKGKSVNSSSLTGVGYDCRNDAFVSVITIVSSLVFLIFDFSIDAYAGVLMSLIILKAGFDILRETIGEIIGRPGDEDLAKKIYSEVRSTDGVLAAVDMMLHNYGPDAWSGSVNIEIDHNMTVGEVYNTIHALQLRIMHEYNVVMVFGIYAVAHDHEGIRDLRRDIREFIDGSEHVKSFHALYIEPGTNNIYCDFIVDYKLRDWEELEKKFKEYMSERWPDRNIILTVETEFV